MSETDQYTTGEVARLLRVSTATVFRAIEKKQLAASTTPGGHHRISRAQLLEYMERNNLDKQLLEPRTWKILIVEDNPVERRMCEKALEKDARYQVRVASSGYEAGFLTKQLRPDLLVIDVFLGDADGRQITKLIRSDPALANMKIIAMSSARELDTVQDIWDSGVDTFMPKPFEPTTLLERVRKLLK